MFFEEYFNNNQYNSLPQFTIKFKITEIILIWWGIGIFEHQNKDHFNQIKAEYYKKLTLVTLKKMKLLFQKLMKLQRK